VQAAEQRYELSFAEYECDVVLPLEVCAASEEWAKAALRLPLAE